MLRRILILAALFSAVGAGAAYLGRSRDVRCMIPAAADMGDGGGTRLSGTLCGAGYTSIAVQANNSAYVYLGFPEGDGGVSPDSGDKLSQRGFTTRNYATTGVRLNNGATYSADILNGQLSCIGQPGAGQDASVPIVVQCLR